MTEQLQALIERIQQEGVAKAETEAEQIKAQATERAAEEVRAAEARAKQIVEQAEQDAESIRSRGQLALEQSARDLLIRVRKSLDQVLAGVVGEAVDEALKPELVADMLAKLAEGYTGRESGPALITALVSPGDQEEVVRYFRGQHQKLLAQGVDIKVDDQLQKGFRVTLEQGHVMHDFSNEAIAEALSKFLRPRLAETVQQAAEKMSHGG